MGHRPDNPAGDSLGQALGRQQAIVQHMRALPPRRGGGRPRDRASLPGRGHHQAGVRVPGADGGAVRGVGALIQRGGRAVAGMLTIATAGGS